MKQKNINTRTIAFTGVFTALVYALTLIAIPNGIGGFAHFGDSMILICATLLNPYSAIIAGSVGAALADVTLGYAFWAPWTLIIKAIMAIICGFLIKAIKCYYIRGHKENRVLWIVFSFLIYTLTEVFMALAYCGVSYIMDGYNPSLALIQLTSNFVQLGFSLAVVVLLEYIMRIDLLFFKFFNKNRNNNQSNSTNCQNLNVDINKSGNCDEQQNKSKLPLDQLCNDQNDSSNLS